MMGVDQIDWSDPGAALTKQGNFFVKEALYLPQWLIMHQPSEIEKQYIVRMAAAMEGVRAVLCCAINVHDWMRPAKAYCPGSKWHGQNYNAYVGSTANRSGHLFGGAVDWHGVEFIGTAKCKEARELLVPHLSRLGIRMENRAGNWVHTDIMPVGNLRFFVP